MRIAILVDLSFFIAQYRLRMQCGDSSLNATVVARAVYSTACAHLKARDVLHRILVYDCKPLAKKAHNPISRRAIDFAKTDTHQFRTALLDELVCKRKVAVRLGELADRNRWLIRAEPMKRLLNGSLQLSDLNSRTRNTRGSALDQRIQAYHHF